MTDLQERKELEDKIKQCDLKSLAMSMTKSEPAIKFTVVYFQRCDLLRQYREKYGEEAYLQLRGQLEEARKDYLNNLRIKKMNCNYLKYKMAQKGDTQKEICELLDISQNALINKMKGKNYFTMREVRLIVERYDLDYEEIKEIFF